MGKYDEIDFEKEREKNNELIKIFKKDLEDSGLSKKTIAGHTANIDLFLNIYLLDREGIRFEESMTEVEMFISYFFIRKCMWSTPASVKTTVASIKKFYKSMLMHGKVGKADYNVFKEYVKASLDEWVEECSEYNSGSSSYDYF